MKSFLLVLILLIVSGLASASEVEPAPVTRQTFTAYVFATNKICDLEKSKASAMAQCTRSGYENCRILHSSIQEGTSDAGTTTTCFTISEGTRKL